MSESAIAEIKRFLKFGVVGAVTAAIYFLILAFQLESLRFNYTLSVSIAYVVAVVFHFIANRFFTFGAEKANVLIQLPKYLILLFVNYLLTIFIARFVVNKIGLSAYYGVLASVPVIMVIGYALSKFWIYKQVRSI